MVENVVVGATFLLTGGSLLIRSVVSGKALGGYSSSGFARRTTDEQKFAKAVVMNAGLALSGLILLASPLFHR